MINKFASVFIPLFSNNTLLLCHPIYSFLYLKKISNFSKKNKHNPLIPSSPFTLVHSFVCDLVTCPVTNFSTKLFQIVIKSAKITCISIANLKFEYSVVDHPLFVLYVNVFLKVL